MKTYLCYGPSRLSKHLTDVIEVTVKNKSEARGRAVGYFGEEQQHLITITEKPKEPVRQAAE